MNICFIKNNFTAAKSNPAFGKKLLDSGVKIRNIRGTKSDACFVEYERNNYRDLITLENIQKEWKDESSFINAIVCGFKSLRNDYYSNGIHLYGLEDEFENTLALAKVIDSYNPYEGTNSVYISYIQTSPHEMYTSKTKHYKGIGETLMSKIVQKARDEGADTVELTSTNEKFWEASMLFQNKSLNHKSNEKFLPNKDFDAYISYVESKTKPKLSICG